VIKRLIRRGLRGLGYDLIKIPPTLRPKRVEEPPAVAPVWPLPRRTSMTDDEIRRELARFPFWHYAYAFEGGLSFPASHIKPGFDTDDPRKPLKRFRHFMPYLVQAEGGTLQGKRVLDIACNSGFWAFQCALLGADVVAFDARPELIEQAKLIQRVTGIDNVQFHVLKFSEMTPDALGGTFDVVLNLGFLYHAPDPLEVLQRTFAMTRRRVLLDTAVHSSEERMIFLRWEDPLDIRMAAESGMVAVPSRSGLELMLRHLEVKASLEIPLRAADMPHDYVKRKRFTWLIEV
jgi:2-polyprenyl-3-methyl-5-hydroxy-6-metoxy-1,4-benzoquinol methylase